MTEAQIKKSFLTYLDENDIFNLVLLVALETPEEVVSQAKMIAKSAEAVLRDYPRRSFRVIVDFSHRVNRAFPASARRIFAGLATGERVTKVAIVGGGIVTKATVSVFFLGLTSNRRIAWFPDRGAAKLWLQA